jgi:hypothetical protein
LGFAPGPKEHAMADPEAAAALAARWNILDLAPGGRGTDRYPALDYCVQ